MPDNRPAPSTVPDNLEYAEFVTHGYGLSALVNLVLVLADNKFFLGRRLSEWCPGGPSLESSVACAAIAQEELGHARALYPLLDEMPIAETPGPLQRGNERKRLYCVSFIDAPLETWPDLVAALALIDPALTVMFSALRESRYEDLRNRARRIPGEERFHRKYADGRVRDLSRTDAGRRALQERVDRLLPEMLCWFGPKGERGVEELKGDGLLSLDNEGLRAEYLDDITPKLQECGIALDVDQDLPWDSWNQLQRRLER
jgi:phenylacetate-CoA oxygenase PaaI subunit